MTDLVLKPTPLQDKRHELVLASGSAIRRIVLANAGLAFSVMPSSVDETELKEVGQREGWSPATVALRLAEAKALAVDVPDAFIIGADQMLSCNGVLFDKPKDRQAARHHLCSLRGQTHILHTAVVVCRNGAVLWQLVSEPRLTMRLFSDAFLEAYLAEEGEHCLASVGAYRIEGPGAHLFERIEGDHTAILGLPLLPLLSALREMSVILS
ncbi:Maf family protein [Acetobacter senegalensis]|uniref:Maf family protein n=1 Tax=Acetobacter senegalensis TaxID=446692 RepID=UPI0026524919|nr:Maf family protein [Acetobacter senegalensis]MDN7352261.1 Maf family protein [Acetobacter senegalensis]